MSKLEGRRSGFSGLRSKSGEWIVIKNKKKRNWQKIETKPSIPMMTTTLFNSHSSSSEDLEGAENETDQNNENEDEEEEEEDDADGGEGDDELENENENEDEQEHHKARLGKILRTVPFSKGPPTQIIRIQPNTHSLPSSPLLSFPPGFVPRPNQPPLKPQQQVVNTRNSNSAPNYHNVDNRTVPSFEKKSAVSGSKQTEKISTVGFCRYFLQGYCRDGKRCVFSHDAAQLKRTQSEPLSIDNSSRSTEEPSLITPSTAAKPIYRSHSSEMRQHSRHVNMDQDGHTAFHAEHPIPMMEELRIPPPFSASSTISDTSSERSQVSLFPASASASPFIVPSPSIPVPFSHLLNGGTYSASNPTSPFASSMSPESLGGLSTFRLNSSYSHVTARDLSEKTVSRSLSRPSSFDSVGNGSPFDNRSRSLTATSETSSVSSSWNSHFPRSAPSHFYAYDTPLRGNSESIILSSVSKPEPSFVRPSAFLSTPSSVPLPIGSPVLSSTASINPLIREDSVKFEEQEDDAKHADLDLKLVECDGPDSVLLDQHSADEIEPENNLVVRDSRAGSGELSSSPSVSPFDPHLITALPFAKIPASSHELLSDPLPLNASHSSGEDSHSESSSPQHQPSRSLLIPPELSIAEDPENEGGIEGEPGNVDATDASPLPSSKPIPIPGSSPSYSSIVRASTSPILTSSSAPLMTKKASIPSSGPLKKEDVKSILPVAALSDKKGRKVCSFFLQGICRYGQQCRHRHLHCVSDKCLSCGQTVGSTMEEQQVHLTLCTEVMAMEKERKESASKKCGICHQLTLKLNRKFGLLISCNHSFCLQCIREWRGSSEHSRERVRACPICKVISHYVIPCDRHVAEPNRKQRVIVEYKWRLGQIDCKHYNRGKAICPFGEACFYRHEDGPPKSKLTRRPKTYNENIFEEDEDDEEEESDTVDQNPKKMENSESADRSHAPVTDSGPAPRDRDRPSSFSVLKFAKKRIPAGIGIGGPSSNVPKNKTDPKKNNNAKYVKGKSKNKK